MSLEKPTLLFAVLFLLGACDSSPSPDNSSRTAENPIANAAQPTTELGTLENNLGESTDGSVDANNSVIAGMEVSGSNNFNIDPASPEFVPSDPLHFRAALLGAWAAMDCRQIDTIFTQPASAHSVFVFTDEALVETEYQYNSANCTGIPSSKWYPLPIRSWNLGAYKTLPDSTSVWELDTTVIQRGVYEGLIDQDIGSNSYVNIDFVDGNLEFNLLVENFKHTRPTSRSGSFFRKITGNDSESIGSDDLLGSWYAACTNRLESEYAFHADTLVVTDENWADEGCEGDSYAVRKTTFNLQYGNSFTSIFEDSLIELTLTAVSNELVKFDDSQGLDQPEFKVLEGKTEYRAVSIDSNTLILAYCLYRNRGEDDCQDSQNRKPDMVDNNWPVRFDKI